jgi:hypothetical protein
MQLHIARLYWHSLDTQKAPLGPLVMEGAHAKTLPYFYGRNTNRYDFKILKLSVEV